MNIWAYWEERDRGTPEVLRLCIESLRRHNPELTVLGSEDARKLGAGEVLDLTEGRRITLRSDLLRLWLLKELGGAWVDTDCIALRPLDMGRFLDEGYEFAAWGKASPLVNSVMAATAGSSFVKDCYTEAMKLVRSGRSLRYTQIGPALLSRLWRAHGRPRSVARLEHWRYSMIPWQDAERFCMRDSDPAFEHYRVWNPNATLYHLTNRVIHWFRGRSRKGLLTGREFLCFLFRRAFGENLRPGRAQEILQRLPLDRDLVGAEIGVLEGRLSRVLLQQRHRLKLYMVDLWSHNPSPGYRETRDHHSLRTLPEAWRRIFNHAKRSVLPFRDRAMLVQGDSARAANRVPGRSLDFVFIDGDHSYQGCRRDIEAWVPKLKPGGLLGGHDYQGNAPRYKFQVKKAVDEFAEKHGYRIETGRDHCWFVRMPK